MQLPPGDLLHSVSFQPLSTHSRSIDYSTLVSLGESHSTLSAFLSFFLVRLTVALRPLLREGHRRYSTVTRRSRTIFKTRGSSSDDIYKIEDSLCQSHFTTKFAKGEFLLFSSAINKLQREFLCEKTHFHCLEHSSIIATTSDYQLCYIWLIPVVTTKKGYIQAWSSRVPMPSWP